MPRRRCAGCCGRCRDCRLWNQYGPTETHVAMAWLLEQDPADWPDLPPIGTPIPGAVIRILDEAGAMCPIGVAGAIWVGGAVLSDGYWGRPDWTAQRFRVIKGDRFYRTGDIGRWLPNGAIGFAGRADAQVKIRGHRVELGEVEAALAALDGVRAAAVVTDNDPGGGKRLIAHVVAPGWEASALRTALGHVLPDPMVPSHVVMRASMPLNVNGKIDRLGLLTPAEFATGQGFRAPRDAREGLLCGLFGELTGTPRVGIDDGFFCPGRPFPVSRSADWTGAASARTGTAAAGGIRPSHARVAGRRARRGRGGRAAAGSDGGQPAAGRADAVIQPGPVLDDRPD